MKNVDVKGIPKIPHINSISCKVIWDDIKKDNHVAKYFPESYVKGN